MEVYRSPTHWLVASCKTLHQDITWVNSYIVIVYFLFIYTMSGYVCWSKIYEVIDLSEWSYIFRSPSGLWHSDKIVILFINMETDKIKGDRGSGTISRYFYRVGYFTLYMRGRTTFEISPVTKHRNMNSWKSYERLLKLLWIHIYITHKNIKHKTFTFGQRHIYFSDLG